jgi:hypothetical protein
MNEDHKEELERNLQTQFQLYIYIKMLKIIKENHNKIILNLILFGKINAGKPNTKIYCTD